MAVKNCEQKKKTLRPPVG